MIVCACLRCGQKDVIESCGINISFRSLIIQRNCLSSQRRLLVITLNGEDAASLPLLLCSILKVSDSKFILLSFNAQFDLVLLKQICRSNKSSLVEAAQLTSLFQSTQRQSFTALSSMVSFKNIKATQINSSN